MLCTFVQTVRIVDMNDEIIHEVVFQHGEFDGAAPVVGGSVVTHELGLQQFEVVYDRREGRIARTKIVDVEYDFLSAPVRVRAILEPVKLIVGQHDVGIL